MTTRQDLTEAQEDAIRAKFEISHGTYISAEEMINAATSTVGCDGAVAVPWCGMWLCIERDGYTHT
jgi:hypothetical protein